MGDKQKKGPSKPAKMSEHDWQKQLRDERRTKKSPAHGASYRPNESPVKLVFVLTPKANKSSAYDSLEKSEVLQRCARRYKYHEPRQLTTMAGRLVVEVPQHLTNQLKRELTPGWKIENAVEPQAVPLSA